MENSTMGTQITSRPGPLFRSWPPPCAVDSDEWRYETWARAHERSEMARMLDAIKSLWGVLGLAALFLLIALLLEERPLVPAWIPLLVRDTGIALLIAFVLGVFIDWKLKHEAMRDVMRATLGYILPTEIKDEMTWITEQHLM